MQRSFFTYTSDSWEKIECALLLFSAVQWSTSRPKKSSWTIEEVIDYLDNVESSDADIMQSSLPRSLKNKKMWKNRQTYMTSQVLSIDFRFDSSKDCSLTKSHSHLVC